MEDVAINAKVLEWFEKRGISAETVIRTGIYSGKRTTTGNKWEIHPDEKGEIVVYPYCLDGKEVNAKYRNLGTKEFYQKPEGLKVFWNQDILNDPALQDGSKALIITEGENDALAVMEAGYPFVVSVPDGAPPAKDEPIQEDVDPRTDKKFSYVAGAWLQLKKIKHIIIAADSDEPGIRLADELVRRLGRIRCKFVHYPPECKDFNEVLEHHGINGVTEVIEQARDYPVSSVYRFSELPPEPPLEPLSTGWKKLDRLIRPFFPSLMVVTGAANTGKSTWTNQLVAQMNIEHGCKVAIASFEMRINPFVSDLLMMVHEDKTGGKKCSLQWIEDNFTFICPEPDNENEQFDVDWLLEKAAMAVIRYGIRILVIDPWNEIEHAIGRRESTTEYTGRAIRSLKRFARKFGVMVVVVAHPSKAGALKASRAEAMRKLNDIKRRNDPNAICEEPEELSLYDISDTAHFANKADFGVVLTRIGNGNMTEVSVVKIRYQPVSGVIGKDTICFKSEKSKAGMFGL